MDYVHTTILDAISEIAAQHPGDIAIVHDDRSYGYGELDSYSSYIASRLINMKLKHGDNVALCLDRSVHAIASMLGAFKMGAAFVPIDPTFPVDRIAYIIADANVKAVLCAPKYQSKFDNSSVDVTTLDEYPITKQEQFVPDKQLTGDDRAYIMYTSGSTGKPKGVPISHRALLNYCRADQQIYQLQKIDRTLQFSTLSFDIAIEEIFPPLMVGSTVVVRPSQRSTAQIELSDIVNTYQITALHLATGYWHEWVDLMKAASVRVPTSIRLMVVTGEKVSPEHYQRWQSMVDKPTLWANAYGPTEATVSATVFIPPSGWHGKTLPIGKPILNYTAYILDESRTPVDKGETGELYIGGPSLAEGYLNKPELTEQAFYPDPFSEEASALMYRTGDLARWMNDGNIEYAGRIDHQLKVGSYRIEPGEIENALNEHTDVKDSLVIADEVSDKKMLLAYIASDNSDLSASKLSNFLKLSLPAYMVPARYVLLRDLPKTLNGKIDRKALPDNTQAVAPNNGDYTAPIGEVQERLCAIWSDILGVPAVGSDSSFITLGGDSLLAVRTISRIHSELGFSISTRDFFYLDTVALLAGYIEGKAVERVVPAPIPEFILSQHRQLYTVLQTPTVEKNNGIGLLIVPSLSNEQRRSQRPFRLLMQNLAKQGYTTLRFDWTGTGNSSGTGSDIHSLDQWSTDIRDAMHRLSENCSEVNVVAVRAGALITANTDLSPQLVKQRYYWDPVTSGHQWLQEVTQLQKGIVSDTYRFLRERRIDIKNLTEFAGLTITKELQAKFRQHDMHELLAENKWNHRSHLLLANPDHEQYFKDLPCHVHSVTEENEWTNTRQTNVDMRINKVAGLLADLLADDNADSTPSASKSERKKLSVVPGSTDIELNDNQSSGTNIQHVESVQTFGSTNQFVGVYTQPSNAQSELPCVLYITAGLLHHVGPTRLHVELARSFSKDQIAGFRFDLSGIGESEPSSMGGYFTERSVAEIRAAMDHIQTTFQHEHFVLLGLCSGADDSLATAQHDERVKGVVLLNGYAYPAGKFKLYRFKDFYLPRMLVLGKWINTMKRLLPLPGLTPTQPVTSAPAAMSDEERETVVALDDDYRYVPPKEKTGQIIDSLTQRGVRLYFIYAGSEHEEYTYEGQLMDMFPSQRDNPNLQEAFIKEADHTYILQTDRNTLSALLRNWFSSNT